MWTGLLLAVVAMVALFVVSRSRSAKSMPASGSVAPEFSLSAVEGSQVSLKDFRGKWVVLYFYPKDFPTCCTIEAHNFQRDQTAYARRHAAILGVRVDIAESDKSLWAQ